MFVYNIIIQMRPFWEYMVWNIDNGKDKWFIERNIEL